MTLSNPQREYLTHRVQTASPLELIRILYEAALQAVEEGRSAFQSGDILKRGQAVTKAIEILSELRISLRWDVHQEYCDTLAGLYTYMQQQLIRAHAEKSEHLFEEVGRLLHTLLEGWVGAMEKQAAVAANEIPAEPEKEAPAPTDANPYSAEPANSQPLARSWQL
jgi:flagellar secretion chaperone FliS